MALPKTFTGNQIRSAADLMENLTYLEELVNDLSPWRVDIDPLLGGIVQTNWSSFSVDATHPYSGHLYSTGAQNAELGWDVVLSAGTWSLLLMHATGPDKGVYSIRIDGGQVASIEGYSAGVVKGARNFSSGFPVAVTGKKRVTLKMVSKNSSSSSYFGDINRVVLSRVA